MKIVSFSEQDRPRLGLVDDRQVVDPLRAGEGPGPFDDALSLIRAGYEGLERWLVRGAREDDPEEPHRQHVCGGRAIAVKQRLLENLPYFEGDIYPQSRRRFAA